MRRFQNVLMAAALIGALVPSVVHAEGPCTGDGGPGGDWPMYGRDAQGTRHQTDEHVINAGNVADLAPAWAFATHDAGDGGFLVNAIVSGRCVFFSDEPEFGAAYVYALDAVTGELIWKVPALADPPPGLTGSWANLASVVVADGRVHANLTIPDGPDGPAAVGVALDADTGERLWTSEPISFGFQTTALASPAVFNGIHMLVTTGPDGNGSARPGYALLRATDGFTLHKQTTIPEADLDAGYAGGGIWTTPSIDLTNGYAYVGTANPDTTQREHAYDDAILKIDVDPARTETFGQVVADRKGDPDNYIVGGDYNAGVCQTAPPILPAGGFNYMCGQLDVDFGAAPTMVETSDRSIVGLMQKSGTFHVVDADTMELVWKRNLSVWTALQGNLAAAANDGERIYVPGNPGVLWALDAETGETVWAAPVGDVWEHHHVALANGVVYQISNHGLLFAYDAATGALLTAKVLTLDSEHVCQVPFSSAVTVAHNTVFATCDTGPDGGYVIAYRLPSA